MTAIESVTPARVAELVAHRALQKFVGYPVRVAVDGPSCADPAGLANAVADAVTRLGRSAVVVETETFLRDASLRLEFGHTDVDAFYDAWLDTDALNREVLRRSRAGSYLPRLRDPRTNRASRVPYVPVADDAVVLVAGELLLGHGLEIDLSVHLAMSASARRRLTPPAQAWTLPAFERYDNEVCPAQIADAVISVNDRRRPAIRWHES